MTPAEFRSKLSRLGLSQLGVGRLLGAGERTPRRWASGDSDIPTPVAILLRLLASKKITESDIERAKDR